MKEETPCTVPLGSYYVALPERAGEGKIPTVLFYHGGGGWGSRIFTMRAEMTKIFTDRGYAVLAPNGKKRPDSKFGPGWAFIPQLPAQRDDLAFTQEVLADAESRFNIDRSRLLMTGYSIGGSLVSYMACKDPGIAAAFAPVSGSFWNPPPEDCAGPVRLLHTHGWRDQTVPLEGRPLRVVATGQIEQGDIFQAMQRWRTENLCDKLRPDEFITQGQFWRRKWTHCTQGSALELALHPGGHEIPIEWASMAIDWFESLMPKKEIN